MRNLMYGDLPESAFRRSLELQSNASREIPDGTSSNYRGKTAYHPFPMIYMDHGDGAMLVDVDGNEYVDFHGGVSSIILGHNIEQQLEVVRRQLERGSYFATAYELEYQTARLLNDLVPASDMTNFLNSGTEAVLAALQLARAYTGKDTVLKFEGMYHGFSDYMLVNVHPRPQDLGTRRNATKIPFAPGIPNRALETVETLPWNDLELLEETLNRRGDQIAAVISEAVMGNSGLIWPTEGFLETVERLTAEHDVLFILDEVITGFRMGLHGAQGYFGIEPDLAIFGKALANGYPCAAITGRREVMEFISSSPDNANVMGTFSGNPLAVAGVKGNLETLADIGESGYENFHAMGERLTLGLRDLFSDAGEAVFIPEFAGFTYVHFLQGEPEPTTWTEWRDMAPHIDSDRYRTFASEMVARGIFLPPKAGRINLMHAHTDEHVDAFLEAAKAAVEQLH